MCRVVFLHYYCSCWNRRCSWVSQVFLDVEKITDVHVWGINKCKYTMSDLFNDFQKFLRFRNSASFFGGVNFSSGVLLETLGIFFGCWFLPPFDHPHHLEFFFFDCHCNRHAVQYCSTACGFSYKGPLVVNNNVINNLILAGLLLKSWILPKFLLFWPPTWPPWHVVANSEIPK